MGVGRSTFNEPTLLLESNKGVNISTAHELDTPVTINITVIAVFNPATSAIFMAIILFFKGLKLLSNRIVI